MCTDDWSVSCSLISLLTFCCTNIYASIKDDLASDRSLFKTELYRALQLLNHIQNLPAELHLASRLLMQHLPALRLERDKLLPTQLLVTLGALTTALPSMQPIFLSLAMLRAQNRNALQTTTFPHRLTELQSTVICLLQEHKNHALLPQFLKKKAFPPEMIAVMEQHLHNANTGRSIMKKLMVWFPVFLICYMLRGMKLLSAIFYMVFQA